LHDPEHERDLDHLDVDKPTRRRLLAYAYLGAAFRRQLTEQEADDEQ
jgi:hypothetical protein